MSFLTEPQRRDVFNAILETLNTRFFCPSRPMPDTRQLREAHETAILSSADADDFEARTNRMLRPISSHIGIFHERRPRGNVNTVLAVTTVPYETPDGSRWMFHHVQADGPAALAGVEPGDVLLEVDDDPIAVPARPGFQFGRSYTLRIKKASGLVVQTVVQAPALTIKKRDGMPTRPPKQVVTARKLSASTGLIHIPTFPGIVGVEVARDISRAVAELDCSNLIFDLRGCNGGGIGCLRVMSHLCHDRRGVGYSLTRSLHERGYDKERLPRFTRIPDSKLGLIPLTLRFAPVAFNGKVLRRPSSVAVFTEARGREKHHGHVAILVDHDTVSAGEMIAAFASEYRLATIVGTATPGRLVSSMPVKVGHGYRFVLPVAAYVTWKGRILEGGNGIDPDVTVPLDPAALQAGVDTQLARAMAVLEEAA